AAGIGAGTELAQLRPYEVGDDVRQIDPSATARTGEPYVRLHVPERTLTTWIVHDVSPSMAFGTATRLKSDVAEGAAMVIGRLALIDPETGERIEVDTARRRVRERFEQIEAEGREQVARELRRLRIEHAVLSTDGDWLRDLGRRLQ